MGSDSENLAKSARRMSIIEQLFPGTENIEETIELCQKLGADDNVIKNLIKDGESYLFRQEITDPETDEKHIILDARLKLKRGEDGKTTLLIDDKTIPEYFAMLNAREVLLKAAADKDGLAGEIFRENLKLKRDMKELLFELNAWKQIAAKQEKELAKKN